MGNRKKFWPLAALAALVLISLALAACGDDEEAGTPTATQRPRETISFDLPLTQYVDIVANLPFAVAQEKGFFAEEGLRPNIIPTRGGGDAVRAIEASAAPLGTASPSATVAAIEGGSALKIVGQVYRGSVIEIAVKANSPIRTFADLKGKKIGFTRPGSATHTLIKAMLAKGGLAQTDATLVPLGDIPSIGIALDEGSIDAGPPAGEVGLAERVDVKKDWRIIATGEDLIPGYFEIAIVVKESTLRDRPELVRSLFRALNKARDYIARNATSDELVQIATRFTNTKPEQVQYLKVVVQDYAGRADRFWGNYSLNMQGFQAIIDDMVETGALRQRPADVNKYLDLSFVR